MPNSPSYLSYPDIKDAFDRVINGGRGIVCKFKDERAAHRFLSRAHSFRVLDRKENLKLYNEGETMYGRSQYDTLRVTREGPSVKIEPIVLDLECVTEL